MSEFKKEYEADDSNEIDHESAPSMDQLDREAFAQEAELRGLIYEEEKGYYIDENGNALNEYGERM